MDLGFVKKRMDEIMSLKSLVIWTCYDKKEYDRLKYEYDSRVKAGEPIPRKKTLEGFSMLTGNKG